MHNCRQVVGIAADSRQALMQIRVRNRFRQQVGFKVRRLVGKQVSRASMQVVGRFQSGQAGRQVGKQVEIVGISNLTSFAIKFSASTKIQTESIQWITFCKSLGRQQMRYHIWDADQAIKGEMSYFGGLIGVKRLPITFSMHARCQKTTCQILMAVRRGFVSNR